MSRPSPNIDVRELEENDITLIVDYFLNADIDFLKKMGVDEKKLPERNDWIKKLMLEFEKPVKIKEYYYIIWLLGGAPVGHSNINKIEYGELAFMHLHLWENSFRQKGLGFNFLIKTIPYYFLNYDLKKIISEPFTLNPAPNKVLQKIGFELEKTYDTVPGWINFRQPVNRWVMTKEKYEQLS